MMGIKDWIAARRYGGQTGLNEMGNNAKMTAIVTAPFLGGWLFIQLFVPVEYVNFGMMGLFCFWIAYCVLIYAYAKADASSYRAFPQAVWRFPDGGVRVFNMLVAPDSWELIEEFEDGSKGYHVNFLEKYQYIQEGLPFPRIFHGAFLKVPSKWDESFAFRSSGEFFHKGIAIDHPACENISVYVADWRKNRDGEFEPVGLVNDCALTYEEFMENSKELSKETLTDAQKFKFLWRKGRKERMNLLEHDALLEDTVGVLRDKSKDIKKQVDHSIGAIRDDVQTVMDTEEPLFKRIFNFKNIMKFAIVALLLIFVGHFFFGFP
jgi:hypothetical protein